MNNKTNTIGIGKNKALEKRRSSVRIYVKAKISIILLKPYLSPRWPAYIWTNPPKIALIAKINPISNSDIWSSFFMNSGVKLQTPPVPNVLMEDPMEMIKTFLLSVLFNSFSR